MSAFAEQLIAWRRELHQHPELSGNEVATTARLRRWLEQNGLRLPDLPLHTGVVAEVGQGEPLIALRADIDALPIDEQSGVAFSSDTPGVMHACGHDIHTSVMLGAAQLLKARERELSGRVRIIFQPAEENFTGAKAVIRAGALQGVSAIFGMHNEPSLPVGVFATRPGAFYANVDRFVIHIKGKGAHAARPQEGKDAIVLATQLVGALQTIASRDVSSLHSVVVSVTRIQGGNTWNVLPETVELEGTVRTHDREVRSKVAQRLRQLAAGFAAAFDAQITIDWRDGPPALINDPHWAGFTEQVAREAGLKTEPADLHMGGEDFAIYLQQIPGAFISLGSASEYGLHHPAYNPDDALLEGAARYFASLAEKALRQLSQH